MVETSHRGGFWPSIYEPFSQFGNRVANWFAPASEASVGENGFRIVLELPGVSEDDISVSVDDGVVTVKGEKRSEKTEEGETWYFSERQYGAFSRSFRLPPEADPANVKADLHDGVLTLMVGRKKPVDAPGATQVPIGRRTG